MTSTNYHKAIFFDFDGVVLETEKLYCEIMLEYNELLGFSEITKDDYIKNFVGKTKKEISLILSTHFKDKYEEKTYWKDLFQFREKYLIEHKPIVKKGFKELMNYLKKENYYIALVSSNTLPFIKKIMSETDISISIFNSLITRENVNRVKPYSDLYEYAICKSNVKKENTFVVEDSEVGITAALNANLKVIHIKDLAIVPDELLSKCVSSVEDLRDVLNILKKGENYGNN